MSGFNEMLAEANAADEAPEKVTPPAEPEKKPEAEPKEDQGTVQEQDEGASDAAPPTKPEEKTEGEEKPPEAPKSILIDDEEIPISKIQETYAKAKVVVEKAKEVDRLESVWKETIRALSADPLGVLRQIFAQSHGEEKADEIIDRLTDDYKIKRFEWANKPDAERRALQLQAQLDAAKKQLDERTKQDSERQHQEAVQSQQKQIMEAIAPHYKEHGLEEFRLPGVLEPGQLIIDALKACKAAGEKPDIAAVVKEVKKSLAGVHAGLKSKVQFLDIEGREDIQKAFRDRDLAAVKSNRRAKTASKPESASSSSRDSRPRMIPASKFDEAMNE